MHQDLGWCEVEKQERPWCMRSALLEKAPVTRNVTQLLQHHSRGNAILLLMPPSGAYVEAQSRWVLSGLGAAFCRGFLQQPDVSLTLFELEGEQR